MAKILCGKWKIRQFNDQSSIPQAYIFLDKPNNQGYYNLVFPIFKLKSLYEYLMRSDFNQN